MINETGLEYPPGGDLTLRQGLKTERLLPGQRDTSNMKNDTAKAQCSLLPSLPPEKLLNLTGSLGEERMI